MIGQYYMSKQKKEKREKKIILIVLKRYFSISVMPVSNVNNLSEFKEIYRLMESIETCLLYDKLYRDLLLLFVDTNVVLSTKPINESTKKDIVAEGSYGDLSLFYFLCHLVFCGELSHCQSYQIFFFISTS